MAVALLIHVSLVLAAHQLLHKVTHVCICVQDQTGNSSDV